MSVIPTSQIHKPHLHLDDVDTKLEVEHVELEVEHVEREEHLSTPTAVGLKSGVSAEIERLRIMPAEELAVLEKRLFRKIDFTLLPTLFILLILNYLDVTLSHLLVSRASRRA
jgi:hypothetical protein